MQLNVFVLHVMRIHVHVLHPFTLSILVSQSIVFDIKIAVHDTIDGIKILSCTCDIFMFRGQSWSWPAAFVCFESSFHCGRAYSYNVPLWCMTSIFQGGRMFLLSLLEIYELYRKLLCGAIFFCFCFSHWQTSDTRESSPQTWLQHHGDRGKISLTSRWLTCGLS